MIDQATQSTVIIIAAIGTQLLLLVAAFFNGWTALSAKRLATDTKAETIAQTAKIDSVVTKAAVIEGHVNSEKSTAEGRENTLKSENALLREMLTDRKSQMALLAQARALEHVTSGAVPSEAASPVAISDVHRALLDHDAWERTQALRRRAGDPPLPVEVVNEPLLTTDAPPKDSV
jgi:hypothetical protein